MFLHGSRVSALPEHQSTFLKGQTLMYTEMGSISITITSYVFQ